jgi:hypothetical protein
MELITAGNPNLDTLASVLVVAQRHFQTKLRKIFLIDTEGSQRDSKGRSLEADRIELVRRLTSRTAAIHVRFLERDGIASELPRIVADELRVFPQDEVIVDMTNGTKLLSGLLYATASLLKIEKLFFLAVSSEARSKPAEDLAENDYRVDVLPPLSEVQRLGPIGYFELIYYREEAERRLLKLRNAGLQSDYLDRTLDRAVQSVIETFFLGRFQHCIAEAGQVGEALAMEIFRLISKTGQANQSKVRHQKPKGFEEAITFLRADFCDPLRGKEGVGLEPHELAFKSMLAADKNLDALRVYRNEASHPRPDTRSREEAKLCLEILLVLVDDLSRCMP